MKAPVFLSASEPYRTRHPEYWDTQHLVNIRAAVRALCAHALPHWPLVYGGHPAITPMVNGIRDRVMHDRNRGQPEPVGAPDVLMFQSALWPVKEAAGVVIIPALNSNGLAAGSGGDRDMSLLLMRYEMLGTQHDEGVSALRAVHPGQLGRRRAAILGTEAFTAGVFIGGMEGVECEFNIFRSFHPHTPAYVLPTTGAAAAKLQGVLKTQSPDLQALLERETAYGGLFQLLLPETDEMDRDLTWRPAPLTAQELFRHSDRDVRVDR